MAESIRNEGKPETLRPFVFELGSLGIELCVAGALEALAGRRGVALLDSARGAPRRHSILGFDPIVTFGQEESDVKLQALGDLRTELARFRLARGAGVQRIPGPFQAGFLGAFSYELGAASERLDLPEAAWPVPPIVGGVYRDWLVFEHQGAASGSQGECAHAVVCARAGETEADVRERLALLVDDLRATPGGTRHPEAGDQRAPIAVRQTSRQSHIERIEAARALISSGEIYQANLCHRLVADNAPDALALYLSLRAVNPAPYMGYLPFTFSGGAAGVIVSASPELLVEVDLPDRVDLLGDAGAERGADSGLTARTRPIKGTIARGETPADDAALAAALLASEKDRAELAMIVDLERNDLGRVAEPGSVRVRGFPSLETYPTVHHLVADVSATIAAHLDTVDVLESVFPGGSITGAPKLRSMEAIAALEREGRGFFTGSLGFLSLDGAAAFNILIRTLIHREEPAGPCASFHVGGGITWNSTPSHEDDETMLKAEGLLAALDAASCKHSISPAKGH